MPFDWKDLRKAARTPAGTARRLRPHRGRSTTLVLAGVLMFALTMSLVWTHSQVNRMTRDLALEKRRTQTLTSRVTLAKEQVRRHSSLREVEPRAKAQLGMIQQQTGRVVELKFDATNENRWDPWVTEAYAGVRTQGSKSQ